MRFQMNSMWFKRKPYGWYPATREGWIVTLAYIGLALSLAYSVDEDATLRELAVSFILPFGLLTTALIRICYKTSAK